MKTRIFNVLHEIRRNGKSEYMKIYIETSSATFARLFAENWWAKTQHTEHRYKVIVKRVYEGEVIELNRFIEISEEEYLK